MFIERLRFKLGWIHAVHDRHLDGWEPSEAQIPNSLLRSPSENAHALRDTLKLLYPDVRDGFGRVCHQIVDQMTVVFDEPVLQNGYGDPAADFLELLQDGKPHYVKAYSCPGWANKGSKIARVQRFQLPDKNQLCVVRVVQDREAVVRKNAGIEKQRVLARKKRLKGAIMAAMAELTPDEWGEVLVELFGQYAK